MNSVSKFFFSLSLFTFFFQGRKKDGKKINQERGEREKERKRQEKGETEKRREKEKKGRRLNSPARVDAEDEKKKSCYFFFHLNKHISLTWYTSYNELWNNRKHLSKHHHELTIFSNPRPPFSYENPLFFSQILLSLLLEYDEVGQK